VERACWRLLTCPSVGAGGGEVSDRGVIVRCGRNLGNLRLVVLRVCWQRRSGSGAMKDWLIALGWLATGATFLFLSVLVLVPGIFG
jgi:hypothetical protein